MTQLNQLIVDIIEMLTTQADEKDIALITDLDDKMPAVAIDPDGVQQVILNLVLNALGAVEKGKGVITIRTLFEELDQDVAFTVHDNGVGIDPEQQERMFTPFESNKGQGGTGIGLAVVKKIVEEHKGTVLVESKPGEGTIFKIVLPTAGQAVTDSGGTSGPGLKGSERKWLFPRR